MCKRSNDQGTVAFYASLDSGGSGIFAGSGGALTTIADSSGFLSGFGSPMLNDVGTVIFQADLDVGEQGIFTGSGGALTTVADTSGSFSEFGRGFGINNRGTVVFGASLDAGGTGIFTGSDPARDKVIATGDPLFGSTVTELNLGIFGMINNSDQLAFFARLADGTEGVFRADLESEPAPVPESASLLGLLTVGAIGVSR